MKEVGNENRREGPCEDDNPENLRDSGIDGCKAGSSCFNQLVECGQRLGLKGLLFHTSRVVACKQRMEVGITLVKFNSNTFTMFSLAQSLTHSLTHSLTE